MNRIALIIIVLTQLVSFGSQAKGWMPETKYLFIEKNDKGEELYIPNESFIQQSEEINEMSVVKDTFDIYDGNIKVIMMFPADSRISLSFKYGIPNSIKIGRAYGLLRLAEYDIGLTDCVVESSESVNGNKLFERGTVKINSLSGDKAEAKYGILYIHTLLNINYKCILYYACSPEYEDTYYHFLSNIEIISSFNHTMRTE